MSPQCKIIFEPHNIDNASPATVSRNGMVYMSSSGLDWRPILQGWLNKRSANEAEIIKSLFDKSFQDILNYANHSLVFKISVLECNHIAQVSLMISPLIFFKALAILFELGLFSLYTCLSLGLQSLGRLNYE